MMATASRTGRPSARSPEIETASGEREAVP
jgi:hypothetical protein